MLDFSGLEPRICHHHTTILYITATSRHTSEIAASHRLDDIAINCVVNIRSRRRLSVATHSGTGTIACLASGFGKLNCASMQFQHGYERSPGLIASRRAVTSEPPACGIDADISDMMMTVGSANMPTVRGYCFRRAEGSAASGSLK